MQILEMIFLQSILVPLILFVPFPSKFYFSPFPVHSSIFLQHFIIPSIDTVEWFINTLLLHLLKISATNHSYCLVPYHVLVPLSRLLTNLQYFLKSPLLKFHLTGILLLHHFVIISVTKPNYIS